MPIPFISADQLEAEADRIIPILASLIAFVPGGTAAVPVLNAIKLLVDNDDLRYELVVLLNKATGAKPT